jgi:hypothetical protein
MLLMPSETFKRFAVFYPDKVGNEGTADLDGYTIWVADVGNCRSEWAVAYNDRHLAGGGALAVALAWLRACDTVDAHKAQLLEAAS